MSNKKVAAIVLAATMVIGSTFTAFAADATPSNGTTGDGTNEGHVDKEVINVVLPTIPEGSTPFAYITDPERLIQGTEGAKYGDVTFPDAAEDTGVYFQVGEKEYANTSNTLQVINKSSADVTVTVSVEAKQASANDLVLTQGDATPSDAAPLYLNLKVGATDTTVSSTKTDVVKTIAGVPDNFEVTYDGSNYGYTEKAGATGWKALNISMNGAVYETAATADTTAPTVEVTWKYEKAASGTSADTADQVDYVSGPSMTVSKTGLVTIKGLTGAQNYKAMTTTAFGMTLPVEFENHTVNFGTWTAENGGDVTIQFNSVWLENLNGEKITVTLTLSDDTELTATTTIEVD